MRFTFAIVLLAAELVCGNRIDHAVTLVAFNNTVERTSDATCTWQEECTYLDDACAWVDIHCREITPAHCTDMSTCKTQAVNSFEIKSEPNEEGCFDIMEWNGRRRRANTAEDAKQADEVKQYTGDLV